jgi:hypothetical protein
MNIGKMVTFAPRSVNLHGAHKQGSNSRTLYIDLNPKNDSIELSTGEEFGSFRSQDRAPLIAQLILNERDHSKESQSFGSLLYVKAVMTDDGTLPSALCFYVSLEASDFQFLWDAAAKRTLPDNFTIEIDGMTYGYAPDATELKWDNTSSKSLPIMALSWNLRINAVAEKE